MRRLWVAPVVVAAVALGVATVASAATSNGLTFTLNGISSHPVGQDPTSVAVGDFNGDGHPDLAVANSSTTVFVLLGMGTSSGGFSPASISPIADGGSPPYAVAVGDFNGDGHPDLAVTNGGSDTVSVLLGNGSGGFSVAPGSPFADGGSSPDSVAVGDFNGDGHADLAVTNQNSNTVSVLLGNGSGGFSAAPGSPFAVGQHPTSLAVGDFNGDGHPDLAVTNQNSNTVSVLLGDGSGGFSPAAGSPYSNGGSGPDSMAVGDFNGDGHLDLAVTNAGSNTVSVLLGDGSGRFSPAPASPIAVGHSPSSVAVGDFNGTPGLAVTNAQDSTVSVLLGDGSGGFSAAPRSPYSSAGSNPDAVAVGDFNGDGHPDLAVADADAPSGVSILLWTAYDPPPPGPVGVSINNGDFATNTTNVQLYVVWPPFASDALISNDGGFNGAGGTKTLPLTPTIPWTLFSAGSERLPKTVYLRFTNNPLQTFTDDIILDTTTPVVQSASPVASTAAVTAVVEGRRLPAFRVRVHATEKLSGISGAQFSVRRSRGVTVAFTSRKHRGILRLTRVVTVRMAKRPRYVRVRSAAGNWSKWHRIT